MLGAHTGQRRTCQKFTKYFDRPNLRRDVKRLVSECKLCKMTKAPQKYYHGPLIATHASRPFERLYIDLIGPLVRSREGYNHILIVVDDVTKYTFLIPLRNATAATVIKRFNEVVIQNFSIPQCIVSDSGSCFRSAEFTNYLFRNGIEGRRILGYQPNNNRSERMIKTVKQQLRAYFHNKQDQWSKDLSYLQLALNSAENQSTKFCSHDLLFSYRFSDPVTNLWKLSNLFDEHRKESNVNENLDLAIKNLKLSVSNNKKREKWSGKYSTHPFKVNDLVYLKTHILSNKANKIQSKLSLSFIGPYKILM